MCSIAATAAAVATAVALAAAAQTAVPPAAAYAARAGASAATPMAYATLFCVSKVLTCGRERERGRGRAMSIVCFEGAGMSRHHRRDFAGFAVDMSQVSSRRSHASQVKVHSTEERANPAALSAKGQGLRREFRGGGGGVPTSIH